MSAKGAIVRKVRDAAATRRNILAAAKARFAQDSYDRVGLRQIAADVGVDVALVARYFGSKENLFDEVLADTLSVERLLKIDRSQFGELMSRNLMGGSPNSAEHEYFLLLLRASMTPETLDQVHRKVDELLIEPMARWLGGKNAVLRTKLLITIMTGMSVQALVTTGSASLGKNDLNRFRKIAASAMQKIVDDQIDDFAEESVIAHARATGKPAPKPRSSARSGAGD